MRNYLENSKIITLLKIIYERFIFLKVCMHNSYIYRHTHNFTQTAKIYTQHSILSKITDKIYYLDTSGFLNNSRFIKFSLAAYNSIKLKIDHSLKRSKFMGLLEGFNEAFYLTPLRTSGIILTCAILTKFLLEVIFNKMISYLNVSVSTFFLLLGLICLTSGADWEKLKKTSYILKFKR